MVKSSLVANTVKLTKEIATQRVAKLFPGDSSTPEVKPELPAVADKPTNELAILVFDASKKIKVIRGRRAREEVGGYLFGDLLGIEMLATEVLRLGENVRKAALAAKDAESAIKNGASAKKSQLKKKAEKIPELAARLQKDIDEIDAATATACAELLQTKITPAGLPDIKSIVVESRPPKPASAPAPEPAEMSTESEMCPRAIAMLNMIKSQEVAVAITSAYIVWYHGQLGGKDTDINEKLELAQVRYKHALRRLKEAYPGEFSDFSNDSYKEILFWTVRLQSIGRPVPAAVAAAGRVGFPLEQMALDLPANFLC